MEKQVVALQVLRVLEWKSSGRWCHVTPVRLAVQQAEATYNIKASGPVSMCGSQFGTCLMLLGGKLTYEE